MKLETAEKIKQELLPSVINKPLVKAGVSHIIKEIEIEDLGNNDYAILVVGEDDRSGVSPLKKSLHEWLSENDNDGLLTYESLR